jgi:hypothetical protein
MKQSRRLIRPSVGNSHSVLALQIPVDAHTSSQREFGAPPYCDVACHRSGRRRDLRWEKGIVD